MFYTPGGSLMMQTFRDLFWALLMTAVFMASLLYCLPAGAQNYIATAYDLSPQSCGKSRDHWAYGITASGYSLKGHTWESARTVSADLSVHPLGTKLHLSFPYPYQHMDGIYTVRDTGGGVRGCHLDVFFGEDAHQEAIKFGRRTVHVTRL